jgi:hypothetical protein
LQPVTIASGSAMSTVLNFTKIQPRGITVETPAAWTAANIGFLVSRDATNWKRLYVTDSDGAAAAIVVSGVPTSTSVVITTDAGNWGVQNYPYFCVVSLNTSTGANVAQGAERVLYIGLVT